MGVVPLPDSSNDYQIVNMKFLVLLSVLISSIFSATSLDPSLPTFQQQFAANLAQAGGNVPGRFSYSVNSVHPVFPLRAQPEVAVEDEDAGDAEDVSEPLPQAALPQYNYPAWNNGLGYNQSPAYNPWGAGYHGLGYPWGQRGQYGQGMGYGGYYGYPSAAQYPGYGYGLNPYSRYNPYHPYNPYNQIPGAAEETVVEE